MSLAVFPRRAVCVPSLAGALLVALVASVASAQSGSGAPYGARDARKCHVPSPHGAPSAAQAALAVACYREGLLVHDLVLLERLRVAVGPGRRYDVAHDWTVGEFDPRVPVYPIRGSFLQYTCGTREYEQTMGGSPDANCTTWTHPNAAGLCFTLISGELRCLLVDKNAEHDRTRVALPRS